MPEPRHPFLPRHPIWHSNAMTTERRWMLALSILLVVGQVLGAVWPRDDIRVGSPPGTVAACALFLRLALYPTGRPVPRWTLLVALVGCAIYIAGDVVGPDATEAWLWPLPIAVPLLALAIGGQGYRYVRRADARERETVRWPLLGIPLALTVVLPADLIAVALTGDPIGPTPALAVVGTIAQALPAIGCIVGLLAPATDLVDRMLALWLTVIVAAAGLGVAFGVGFFTASAVGVAEPWPAVISAAAAVVAGVWGVPLAGRIARRAVFRGRAEEADAVRALTRRLSATLDATDIPAVAASEVQRATGAESVVLRRSGRVGAWAVAGAPAFGAAGTGPAGAGATDAGTARAEASTVIVTHLGLPVAELDVWPRPAESGLSAVDLRIIEALARAAGPALHGARLASAFPELTERERQILGGIAQGLPNAAIAARLGVSGKTVANYVSIVLTKLRVPDRERAAELARRRAAT